RRRADYVAVQSQGRRLGGAHYLLFVRPSSATAETAESRVGVTVSRKVGNAVVRNRVKRWVRESCRQSVLAEVPPGLDLVIVARPSAANAGLGPTALELASLVKRLRGR
ncbi:MAG TPA: ribonuclease P protein component, partial [Polyangia bacterium]|nr:ribonuclease P protein component [Polyangia bacterium]